MLWSRFLGLGLLFLACFRPFGPDSLDLVLSLALALLPRLSGPGRGCLVLALRALALSVVFEAGMGVLLG